MKIMIHINLRLCLLIRIFEKFDTNFTLHGTRTTIRKLWRGLWDGSILGTYFFLKMQNEDAVTVNSERYRSLLKDCLWLKSYETD